jgi:heat shock protein HslJ
MRISLLCIAFLAITVPVACARSGSGRNAHELSADSQVVEAAPSPDVQGETLAVSGLLGTWEWVSFLSGDGSLTKVVDPSRYTLEIRDDGFSVVADCNRGAGSFELDGASLRFVEMRMTRVSCPPGSLGGEYAGHLENVRTWLIDDGDLYLSLWADAGIMRFRPAGKRGL